MKPLYGIFKGLFGVIFPCFMPTVCCGKKRKKNCKPVILVGNHLSMSDIIVSGINHPRQIYNLGKKELTTNKMVAGTLRALGLIPVSRGAADLDAMRTVLKTLKAGGDIQIFPEGTRNLKDNRLCKTYGGAAMFAIKSKTQIIPFAFNTKAKFGHKNYMVSGDPVDLSEYYGARLDSATLMKADELVRQKLIEVKRMADFLARTHGVKKKALKRQLNNPQIPFDVIYRFYEPYLFDYEYSVKEETSSEGESDQQDTQAKTEQQ